MASIKLTFGFQFIASKLGKTGLTPTFTVKTVNRASGAIGSAVTGSCTELFDGMYFAQVASCDPRTYVYFMSAHTSDTTVDQQDVGALWAEFSPAADIALPDVAAGANGGMPTGNASGQVTVVGFANNAITAASIAAAALNGKGDWVLSGTYTAPPTVVAIRTEMDANSTKLIAIKGKTDQLTFFAGGDPTTGDPALEVVTMFIVNDAIRALSIQGGALNGKGDWGTAATLTAIKGAGWVVGDNLHQLRVDVGNVSGGGGGGTGSGAFPVDHDGGAGVTIDGVASSPDCLRYLGTDGGGRDGLFVTAYLASEWDAVPTVRDPKGTTQTGADGRWLAPLMLDSGTYYLVADNQGDPYQAQLNTLVVP